MSDKLNVTFECKSCGANPATLELPDDYTDDSVASCKACGQQFGRWGDVKAKATEAGKDALVGMVKDAFKGMKGWKVK